MRIIDCFTFFNEIEILKLRLELLYDCVDKFIITEANHTHKGDYKGFKLKNQLDNLGISLDKIVIIEETLPSYLEENNAWVRERMQRNSAARFILDDDVAIISDCDEIIMPDMVPYYVSVAKQYPNCILRIPMDFLMARADLRVYDEFGNPRLFSAPFICMKNHLTKYTLSDIREAHSLNSKIDFESIYITEDNLIKNAGWHFSWMGDMNRMKEKLTSFLHWNEVNLVENYEPTVNNTDPLGRTNHLLKEYPVSELPKIILDEDYYRNFFLPEKTNNIYFSDTSYVNYTTRGNFGDLINELWVIKMNYEKTGKKGRLFLTTEGSSLSTGFFIKELEYVVDEIKYILKKQDYIEDVHVVSNNVFNPINLSSWRDSEFVHKKSFTEICINHFEIDLVNQIISPWLKIDEMNPVYKNKVILHESINQTRKFDEFPWEKIIAENDCLFISFDDNTINEFKYKNIVDCYKMKDFEECCLILNSCQFYVGNLTSITAIAQAIGVPRLIELRTRDLEWAVHCDLSVAQSLIEESKYYENLWFFADNKELNNLVGIDKFITI